MSIQGKQEPKDVKNEPVKPNPADVKRPKKTIQQMQEEDAKMVRGLFKFFDVPGGSLSFSYKKYKNEPVQRYDLVDGQIATIPLGVAKHLNNDCWYPEYDYVKDENMSRVTKVTKKIRRTQFTSLEFMDVDDYFDAGTTGPMIQEVQFI